MHGVKVALVLLMTFLEFAYGHVYSPDIIDLSHDLAEDTIHWPAVRPFSIVNTYEKTNSKGIWSSNKEFCSNEHVGTHIDAPVHFAKGQWTVDEIPIERLVDRPAVVIDIKEKVSTNSDAALEVDDILQWEKDNGQIVDGSVVLMYSGWGKRHWPNKTSYYGTNNLNDSGTYHFPGFHSDATKWLIDNRKIYGIGVDSASGDFGQSQGALTHRYAGEKNLFILENVANLDQLPATGALITIMPMKIRGGTGGPTRLFARILLDGHGHNNSIIKASNSKLLLLGSFLLAVCLVWFK